MRGELAQARPVTFSAAATATGTRIKSAWCETGSVSAHSPSDLGDLSKYLNHRPLSLVRRKNTTVLSTSISHCPATGNKRAKVALTIGFAAFAECGQEKVT